MTGKEYQQMAMRTNDRRGTSRLLGEVKTAAVMDRQMDIGGILNGCLGLSGETGEFNDMIKKWIFHEKPLDSDHAKKELGDVLWYAAMVCASFGWDLDEIMRMNIDKLQARYPEGFDVGKSAVRAEGDV